MSRQRHRRRRIGPETTVPLAAGFISVALLYLLRSLAQPRAPEEPARPSREYVDTTGRVVPPIALPPPKK